MDELGSTLTEITRNIEYQLKGMKKYGINGNTKRYVKYVLARITNHIEKKSGLGNSFEKYFSSTTGKSFTIEHLLSKTVKYAEQGFDEKTEFEEWRNRIGALILLPESFNTSYGSLSYVEKLPYYFGQNLLAKSLSPLCYENNPEFVKYRDESKIPFKPHPEFKKKDIEERQRLYQSICEEIWSSKGFSTEFM